MSLNFFPYKLDWLDSVKLPMTSSWSGGQEQKLPPSLTSATVETPDSQARPGKPAQALHGSDELTVLEHSQTWD